MRQAQAISGLVIGEAVALLAVQPVWAAVTQVTAVELNESGSELQLTLETEAGNERPEVFTVSRGNDLVADIANTKLNLNKGNSFRQENPLPGITSVLVSQLDPNSVRVTVSGASRPPSAEILQQNKQGISLSFSLASANPTGSTTPEAATQPAPTVQTPSAPTATPTTQTPTPVAQVSSQPATAPAPTPNSFTAPQKGQQRSTPVAQVPNLPTLPSTQTPTLPSTQTPTLPTAQAPTIPQTIPAPAPGVPATPGTVIPAPQPSVPAPAPDVLVPNPRVTIEGPSADPAGTVQPVAPAPPFLPRAVAPPLGDIAVSNINASGSTIDLGTGVRVPRLVLREAPVREVLSLLARSAGLNVAFTDGAGAAPAAGAEQQGAAPPGAQRTISLDVEDESVQDLFNYVLQISGLQANRVGRTILVGAQLPLEARNLVSRTLRLNQIDVARASGFLISQGAEEQRISTQDQITVAGEGAAAIRTVNRVTTVERLTPQVEAQAQGGTQGRTAALVLRGLAVSVDERLNAVTLVGEPRQVEVATALLTQLDLRRRQVAVNVKIVDINLLGTDAFNASFSFGIGDGFFAIDQGAAVFNYGGFRPPTAAQVAGSTVSPPVITNPFAGASVFFDPNNLIRVAGTSPGTIRVTPNGVQRLQNPGAGLFPAPTVNLDNPLQPGFITVTPATDNIITVDANGTATATPGTVGTVTAALPALFQFPNRLLAALQAQVTSGNAKILTDPTIVVQEDQTAVVNLTQEVFGGFRSSVQTDPTTNLTTQVSEPIIKNAGLILEINVQRIDDNGFVTLTVNPIVSALGGSANTPQGTITLVQERQLQSGQIRLRDGQTLILSGIIQESDRTTVTKVPILGDIPILGALFRSTQRANQRQEVIVLLTPQILQDGEGASFGYNYTPGRDARQLLQR